MNKKLFIQITFFLLSTVNLTFGDQPLDLKEDPLACPITSPIAPNDFSYSVDHDSESFNGALTNAENASWKTTKEHDSAKLGFNSLIIRRVGISLSSENPEELISVSYKWTGWDNSWGNMSGRFLVKGDGILHCFFLGQYAHLPENVPSRELVLFFPKGISLHNLIFTSEPSDRKLETCPKPELFKKTNEAYESSFKNPNDEQKSKVFVTLLKKMMRQYDCRRVYDYKPVPAWWLCGNDAYSAVSAKEDPEKWFELLSKLKSLEARKLYGSELFRSTLDGEVAEVYYDDSLKVEKELRKKQ